MTKRLGQFLLCGSPAERQPERKREETKCRSFEELKPLKQGLQGEIIKYVDTNRRGENRSCFSDIKFGSTFSLRPVADWNSIFAELQLIEGFVVDGDENTSPYGINSSLKCLTFYWRGLCWRVFRCDLQLPVTNMSGAGPGAWRNRPDSREV
ncbi:hypothetical protein XENORESO_012596 [Xenotaenia resolanae]|uniref:Uncharacterized protein n=1 Tax=Xenotaenia resolanae TaxID=208358 RepID=A0ABV0WMR1_9TELE